MVSNRKGIPISKLDLEVNVDKQLINDQHGIYVVEHEVEWGRDGEYKTKSTVYNHNSHDLAIDMLLRDLGLLEKRIKRIKLTAKQKVGVSITRPRSIIKWKITNEFAKMD